jgi:DNA-binding NarL/FixJ family response regulator
LASVIGMIKEHFQTGEALEGSQKDPWHLLDKFDVLFHIIDLNSYEIVYANKFSKRILGNVTGKICWKAFHAAQEEPCSFCPRMKLFDSNGNPLGISWRWEMQNTRNGHWYELMDKAVSWADGRQVKLQIAWDITKRKRTEDAFRRGNNELESCVSTCFEKLQKTGALLNRKTKEHRKALSQVEEKASELEAVNAALQVILDKYRKQENELEEKIVSNIKNLIFPYMDILERYLHERRAAVCFGLVKEKLVKLSSSFSKKLSSDLLELTPREIQVADLIKEGRTTKEIADFLHLSSSTVECFRDRLREKLGIKNKKVNLRSFLISNFQ